MVFAQWLLLFSVRRCCSRAGDELVERVPVRIFGARVDITERKHTEAELREREERLRLAAEAAHFGHYDRNLKTGAFYISPRLKRILGYPPDAGLTHEAAMAHFHPDDRQTGIEAFARACDPVATIVRTFGHAATEIWAATEWEKFTGLLRSLPPRLVAS